MIKQQVFMLATKNCLDEIGKTQRPEMVGKKSKIVYLIEKFEVLNQHELIEIGGGILPILIAGTALLLASCNSQTNKNYAGSNSININGAGIVATDSAKVTHNEISAKIVVKP